MLTLQGFMGKKAVLETVRVAAYCPRRLTRNLVLMSNIPSSVDAILHNQVPIRTYGVLGFLLLGIVRIYSKKVQFVCDEFDGLLVELNEFVVKKTTNTTEAISAPSPSITRPSTFQLDAFDLQISEERTCSHVRPSEALMLEGARKDTEFYSPNDVLDYGTFPADSTPFSDVFSLQLVDPIIPDGEQMGVPNAEEPVGVDEGPSSMAANDDYEQIMEIVEDIRMVSFESTEESIDEYIGVDQDMDSVVTIRMISPESSIDRQTSATIDATPNDPNTSSVGAYDEDEHITPESRTIRRASVNIDATPILEGTSGTLTPAFTAVQTPDAKESGSFSRKRKSLVDDIPKLPTSVMKEIIANPTDLVRGRSRVSHARVHGWKIQINSNLSHSVLDPLIPSSSGLGSILSFKDIGKVLVLGATEVPQTSNISPIAPSTPIAFSSSSMFHDDPCPTMSSDSMEDIKLINKDVSSSAGDSCEMDKWSVRTQSAARYLRRNFMSQKKHQEDDDVASLFEILKGKKKKHSARMFHEILVLKSGGYVDVKQEEPYDDIVVAGTCKMKNFCDF